MPGRGMKSTTVGVPSERLKVGLRCITGRCAAYLGLYRGAGSEGASEGKERQPLPATAPGCCMDDFNPVAYLGTASCVFRSLRRGSPSGDRQRWNGCAQGRVAGDTDSPATDPPGRRAGASVASLDSPCAYLGLYREKEGDVGREDRCGS